MGNGHATGLARTPLKPMDREGQLRAMDSDELRRVMNSMGIVKLHYFGDGRKVFIKESSELSRPRYNIAVQNVTTNFAWSENIPYYDLDKCIATAEGMFGIRDWNAV